MATEQPKQLFYCMLVTPFPGADKAWISITPTVHKLLGHSWEMIESNDECRLKCPDESGLEETNKVLRSIRSKLSRKISQSSNLQDTFTRLWMRSDPKVDEIYGSTRPFCKFCKDYGHTERYCTTKTPEFGPMSCDDIWFQDIVVWTTPSFLHLLFLYLFYYLSSSF